VRAFPAVAITRAHPEEYQNTVSKMRDRDYDPDQTGETERRPMWARFLNESESDVYLLDIAHRMFDRYPCHRAAATSILDRASPGRVR